jgi:hypothetical protein
VNVRRVVTGKDANGKSVFVSDEEVEPIILQFVPGLSFIGSGVLMKRRSCRPTGDLWRKTAISPWQVGSGG